MSPSPRSIVLTGANRGIGLGLVKHLLLNQDIQILIATARNVSSAKELNAIKDSRLVVLPLEVTNDNSIDEFVKKVDGIVGEHGLNCLINNAGVLIPYTSDGEPSREKLTEQFNVNTVSVVLLTQKLLPLLRKASSRVEGPSLSTARSSVINISSFLGSIACNDFGSKFHQVLAYRMSKTALNQFTKTLSIDLKDDHILVVSFEPGWVQTDLGGSDAPLTVEESTRDLAISFMKLDDSHNGGYFYRGLESIKW